MIPLLTSSFLILRHGRTPMNASDRIAGSLDVGLDATGRAEAETAAVVLAAQDFAAIWCSPLLRARQTAAAVAARTGHKVQIVPDLAERCWGDWQGQPRAILRREATPPGGENPEVFAARTRAGLARITPPLPVLIVAHSGTARVLADLLAPDTTLPRLGNAEALRWSRAPDGRWQAVSLNRRCPVPDQP
ncbi:histidine phosphatase family protein [Phaeovulum veldkampii]|uniref:histidine phosphatase family protein n=1 Tax=Phaeovulum veldkampii TaxID=33049 RepID=UPI0010614951|nr:histidine phosphatase family protein [Phaeovulum veldkampii]TDQ58227.1 putative phosphoglycerate mutase [Phaeovulum veldkampii DSM 11550]